VKRGLGVKEGLRLRERKEKNDEGKKGKGDDKARWR
jgi:hypothetical protein